MTAPTPETLVEIERMLPCKYADNCGHHDDTGLCHWDNCHPELRPAVAQAVQSLKDRNAELERELAKLNQIVDWQPWDAAPKDASEILVQAKDKRGYLSFHVIHWASDLSGEEQPPFRGWFYKPGENGFAEFRLTPVRWRRIALDRFPKAVVAQQEAEKS